jgi:sulfite exporter TauE/SafE
MIQSAAPPYLSVILQNGVWQLFDVFRFYQRIHQMLEDLLDLEIAVSGHLAGKLYHGVSTGFMPCLSHQG